MISKERVVIVYKANRDFQSRMVANAIDLLQGCGRIPSAVEKIVSKPDLPNFSFGKLVKSSARLGQKSLVTVRGR